MTLPAVDQAAYPTPTEVRTAILNDMRYKAAASGIVLNVKEGSDEFLRADSYAKRISIGIANNKLALAQSSPLTATGQHLADVARVYGVTERAASSAGGFVVITLASGYSSVTIPADFTCVAPNGVTYATTTSQTVTTGASVAVVAVDTGTKTNQSAGVICNWTSAAVGGLVQTCTVDIGGIGGGSDADDDERLRQRLLARLAFPGVGGNWSQVAQWATEASAGVETAFVYPAARGPASVDVVVTKAGTDRTLSADIVASVASYIAGKYPGHIDLNVTSVSAQEVDVVVGLTLPAPINAGGAGGGWRDSSPWPGNGNGLAPSQTGTPNLTFTTATTGGTITRSTGSWIQDRFLPGMTITIANTVSNNGSSHVISAVTSTVLTMSTATTAEVVAAIPAGSVTSSTTTPVYVTAKSGNTITVTSSSSDPPAVGDRFGLWDEDAQEVKEFTTKGVTGSSGAYVVTLDTGASASTSFLGADGDVAQPAYVSAGAFNLPAYGSDLLAELNKLGPGEKTSNVDILPRGLRHPGEEIQNPYRLGTAPLILFQSGHGEVLDVAYATRVAAGSSTALTAASVPAATADPARILVIRSLAFRPI